MNGILHGFDIIEPTANLTETFVKNHKSILLPEIRIDIDNIIKDEISEGNYVICNQKPTIVSALGVVPKSDGGWRLIHDCSLPTDTGLNSHSPQFEHYSYESLDDAVALLSKGYYMAKVDIRHAYRCIPISTQSCRATGMHWTFQDGRSVFMYDCKLPFGARASPTIFHRVSQAIKRMMARRGYSNVIAYQDDYLIVGKNYEECFRAWTALITLLGELGLPVNHKKLVSPTTCITFLGIQLDTEQCKISLPDEKLDVIRTTVADFLQKRRATKQQLQSLAGRLSFAARAVRGARFFLRRLFTAIAGLKRQHHKVRLRGAIRGDILWWHKFLVEFNGETAFIDVTNVTSILTDACLFAGGAFYKGDMYYTVWSADYSNIQNYCINYKEAMIATLAVKRWAPSLKDKYVYIYTDNQCTAAIINKCSCRCEVIMQSMREMFWCSVRHNFVIRACYMPGFLQSIPDAISRMHERYGLSKVCTLLNEWHECHTMCGDAFQHYNMLNHMSMQSLCYILEQVMAWRKVKFRWTVK